MVYTLRFTVVIKKKKTEKEFKFQTSVNVTNPEQDEEDFYTWPIIIIRFDLVWLRMKWKMMRKRREQQVTWFSVVIAAVAVVLFSVVVVVIVALCSY